MDSDGRDLVLLTLPVESCGGGNTRSLASLCSWVSLIRTPAVTSQRASGFQSNCAYCPANTRRSLTVPISLTCTADVGGGSTEPSSGTVYPSLPFRVVCWPWPYSRSAPTIKLDSPDNLKAR